MTRQRAGAVCGILMPSAFADFRLSANSNLLGCSTGRSAGLAPFRVPPWMPNFSESSPPLQNLPTASSPR
jgi:hypothetical protein